MVSAAVSAELRPFEKLEGTKNKGRATSLQRVLVPWLISKYGMSYKSAKIQVVSKMVEAIIDKDDLLDLGCRAIVRRRLTGTGMRLDSIRSLERPSRQQVRVYV